MECITDKKKRLAQVWMSHSDQASGEKQEKLRNFIAQCRAQKIFVCVYESGYGDIVEKTKELLTYNYNNCVSRTDIPDYTL